MLWVYFKRSLHKCHFFAHCDCGWWLEKSCVKPDSTLYSHDHSLSQLIIRWFHYLFSSTEDQMACSNSPTGTIRTIKNMTNSNHDNMNHYYYWCRSPLCLETQPVVDGCWAGFCYILYFFLFCFFALAPCKILNLKVQCVEFNCI